MYIKAFELQSKESEICEKTILLGFISVSD